MTVDYKMRPVVGGEIVGLRLEPWRRTLLFSLQGAWKMIGMKRGRWKWRDYGFIPGLVYAVKMARAYWYVMRGQHQRRAEAEKDR